MKKLVKTLELIWFSKNDGSDRCEAKIGTTCEVIEDTGAGYILHPQYYPDWIGSTHKSRVEEI